MIKQGIVYIMLILTLALMGCSNKNEIESSIKNTYTDEELKIIDEFYTKNFLSEYKSIIEIPINYDINDAEKDNVYIETNTKVINQNLLDKFVDDYKNKKESCIRIIKYTLEGSPIIYDIILKDNIEIIIDNTRDDYSANKGISKYVFENISEYNSNWVAHNGRLTSKVYESGKIIILGNKMLEQG